MAKLTGHVFQTLLYGTCFCENVLFALGPISLSLPLSFYFPKNKSFQITTQPNSLLTNEQTTGIMTAVILLLTVAIYAALYLAGIRSKDGSEFLMWCFVALATGFTALFFEKVAEVFSKARCGKGCRSGGYLGASAVIPVLYFVGISNDFHLLALLRLGIPMVNFGFLVGLLFEAAF